MNNMVPKEDVVKALEAFVRKVVNYPTGLNLEEAKFLVEYMKLRDNVQQVQVVPRDTGYRGPM